jgi:hypothetical protein
MAKRKRDTYRRQLLNNFLNSFKVTPTKKQVFPNHNRLQNSPFKIAIVLDGEVQDIIHCNERLFFLLTSDPQILDISKEDVSVGDYYDYTTKRFFKDD